MVPPHGFYCTKYNSDWTAARLSTLTITGINNMKTTVPRLHLFLIPENGDISCSLAIFTIILRNVFSLRNLREGLVPPGNPFVIVYYSDNPVCEFSLLSGTQYRPDSDRGLELMTFLRCWFIVNIGCRP